MHRNRFKNIKSCLMCNNEHIDPSDKLANLRPLFNVVNRELTKFEVLIMSSHIRFRFHIHVPVCNMLNNIICKMAISKQRR